MSASVLQMELQYSDPVEALSYLLWKIAQSLFVVIMILSPLQICCCKRKAVQTTHSSPSPLAGSPAVVVNQTPPEIAPRTPAVPDRANTMEKDTKPNTSKRAAGAKNEEKKKEDETQMEDLDDSDKEKPDIIPMDRIKKMGNIDVVFKEKKTKMDKEIEEMKSTHEMDDNKPLKIVNDPKVHVKIDEKRCKLYETNDEPTLDDEVEDQLI